MNREYQKQYSRELERSMEVLVFGSSGLPAVIFPTSKGRFFDYEDRGMVAVVASKIERNELQLFCVDSVDNESWYNRAISARDRVRRHINYEGYLLKELLPWIRSCNQSNQLAVAGCSFGGYHALNFALRHPDLVSYCVSMGGAFDIHQFLDGYYDENCYFHCPPDYISNLTDEWYLSRYRQMTIVLATGEDDICRAENERISRIMRAKQIPHRLDIWGDHTGHDWPWWQRMEAKFFL
ncbi:MAG: esterase family protein [Acidobacteria bacterium]|nr:esterase family protein [Acidobacteriota bacterium]